MWGFPVFLWCPGYYRSRGKQNAALQLLGILQKTPIGAFRMMSFWFGWKNPLYFRMWCMIIVGFFLTIFSLKQQRLKNTGKSCRLFLDLKTRASHVLEVCRAMFENRATLQGSRKSCLDLGSLIFLTGGGKVWSIVLTRWLAWIIFVVFFFRRGPTWIMPCF